MKKKRGKKVRRVLSKAQGFNHVIPTLENEVGELQVQCQEGTHSELPESLGYITRPYDEDV